MKTWRVEDWDEAREERAAIMEYDGGLSREEADAASLEWLVDFLAPQILAWAREHGRPWVEEWLGRYGSRYGAAAERQLRDKLNEGLKTSKRRHAGGYPSVPPTDGASRDNIARAI